MKRLLALCLFFVAHLGAQPIGLLAMDWPSKGACSPPGRWSDLNRTTTPVTCLEKRALLPPPQDYCQPAPTGLPPLPAGTIVPELPNSCIVPDYPFAAANAAQQLVFSPPRPPIRVRTFAALQAAVTRAQCGDWIQVAPGTYTGALVVPGLSCPPSNPVLIENEAIDAGCAAASAAPCATPEFPVGSKLFPQWTTVSPSLAGTAFVPVLESGDSNSPVYFSDGAANWYMAGVEVTLEPSATNIYPIVAMGENTTAASSLPNNITLDRVLVHPAPCPADSIAAPCDYVARGVDLNAVNGAVMFSAIWGIVAAGRDTQAINVNNTTGPGLIVGNYLEATGENIMFNTECTNNSGGTAANGVPLGSQGYVPGDQGLTTCDAPSDFTVRLNRLAKLPAWRTLPTGCDAAQSQCYDIKNLAEVKHGQRILIDSNVMGPTWHLAQNEAVTANCFAAGIYVCRDLTLTSNLFVNVPLVLVFSGNGEPTPPTPTVEAGVRIMTRNNLAVGVTEGYGDFQNCRDCVNDHNTVIGILGGASGLFFADQPPSTDAGFVWTNNITPGDAFANACPGGCAITELPAPTTAASIFYGGYWSYAGLFGAPNLPAYPRGLADLSAAAISDTSSTTPPTTCQNNNADWLWCFPRALDLVGFTDWRGANAGTNLPGAALSASSPYRSQGADGADMGANVAAVLAAVASVK